MYSVGKKKVQSTKLVEQISAVDVLSMYFLRTNKIMCAWFVLCIENDEETHLLRGFPFPFVVFFPFLVFHELLLLTRCSSLLEEKTSQF